MQIFNYQTRKPVVFNFDSIVQALYGDRCESITIKIEGDRPQQLTFNFEMHRQQFTKLEKKLVSRGLL